MGQALAPFGLRIVRVGPAAEEPPPPLDPWVRGGRQALPDGARERLRADHPRLRALIDEYGGLDSPACTPARRHPESVRDRLGLLYFRGGGPDLPSRGASAEQRRLLCFVALQDVLRRDRPGLVGSLGEDGLFGCEAFDFPGYPLCSHELLQSAEELLFLDRHLSVLSAVGLRILDFGAGFGRLAHRATRAIPVLADYCCVDAEPEMTFVSEYYVEFRGVAPPARVVPLPDVVALQAGRFDLALSSRAVSGMPEPAFDWWMAQVERLRIRHLFLVLAEPTGLGAAAGPPRGLGPVIARHGYRLVAEEPPFGDAAIRDLLGVSDLYCLFERVGD